MNKNKLATTRNGKQPKVNYAERLQYSVNYLQNWNLMASYGADVLSTQIRLLDLLQRRCTLMQLHRMTTSCRLVKNNKGIEYL